MALKIILNKNLTQRTWSFRLLYVALAKCIRRLMKKHPNENIARLTIAATGMDRERKAEFGTLVKVIIDETELVLPSSFERDFRFAILKIFP